MILLFKTIELIAIFFVIRFFIKAVIPSTKQNSKPPKPAKPPERFNEKECDISDGDYEEL